MLPETFNTCCLCDVSKYDEDLSEFEAEHIHVEGVCVDCKIGVEDTVDRTLFEMPVLVM